MEPPSVPSTDSKRVMIFANPIAGRGRSRVIAHDLERQLRSEGYVVDTFWERPADVSDEQVAPPGPPAAAVITIGGDGTGSLVHGTGVPILFPSEKTYGSR